VTPQLILVAGPYRNGTNGDAALIAGNLHRLEEAALQVYGLGHLPMIGEWAALPLAAAAGSKAVGDAISETLLYPVANRLIRQCDAVFRIDGASQGADADVRLAEELRLPAFGLDDNTMTSKARPPLRAALSKGVLSSLLNPKALLFCSVLLPQFVHPNAGAVWSQVLELGVVLVVIGALFDTTLAFSAVRMSRWLRSHPRAQVLQRWTFPAALLAFALRLSIE
jgi:hypothetical protein